MKNGIDNALFQKTFDFLKVEYNFIRKGSLYIRVINNQIIQTVFPFRMSPMHIDLNIGLFSVYENIDSGALKEGRFRMFDLTHQVFEIHDPSKTILALRRVFIDQVIPMFVKTTSLSEMLDLYTKMEYFNSVNMFNLYFRMREFDKAYQCLVKKECFLNKALEMAKQSNKNDELSYDYGFGTYEENMINELHKKMNAIINSDPIVMSTINDEIEYNYRNNKEVLRNHGITICKTEQ